MKLPGLAPEASHDTFVRGLRYEKKSLRIRGLCVMR